MAGAGLRLKNFYQQHTKPHYPSLLVARRSLKIMVAMVLSLLILQPWPHLMTWGPLAAFLLCQVPPGLPLAARRKAMLVLTLFTALLMPLATLAADGVALPTLFVILATFAAFWGAALGPAYGACGLWALLLVVVALGKPAPLDEGLARAAAVALGGGLCWCFQFLVLPIRPRQIYSAALGLALENLDQLWTLLEEGYPQGKVDPKRLEELKSGALTALHRLRGIPQFLELPSEKVGGSTQAVLALGLDLVRVYENLLALWQVRQLAADWPLFQTHQEQLLQGLAQSHGLLREVRQAQAGSNRRPDPTAVIDGLARQVAKLRGQAQENEDKRSVGDYVAVTNSLTALVSLARDLGRAEGQRRALELLQLPAQHRAAPSQFRTRLRQELRLDSPILRSSLQASVAAGVGMVLIKTLNLHNGYWVVLFALLVVKPDLGSTLAMGKRRVIGTVLGAAAAIFFLLEVASSGPIYNLTALAGAYATLFLMSFPHPVLTGGVSCFTMLLLSSAMSPLGWELGFWRMGEVALAVAIGLGAASFIWPNRASRRMRQEAAQVLEQLAAFLDQATKEYLAGDMNPDSLGPARQKLQAALDQLRASYQAAGLEPGRNPALARRFGEVIEHEAHLFDQMLALEAAAGRSRPQGVQTRLEPQLSALSGRIQAAMLAMGESLAKSKRPRHLPDLVQAHAAVSQRMGQVGAQIHGQPGRLTLSSFLWELRQMEREVEGAATVVTSLASS
ncbi:MAG: FUSC family protein [Proteobacteria bacterium]|nr:FUSC family protein [Pseudomonadota bacterium]MBU4381426.1 FUSC family protein [Pseudomonadota bacterium]MCG2764908.1 FUSC family protein [Desulfarculaceae bacterium]